MERSKALISYISNHFSMHPARIIIMLEIILSMIKIGGVQQHKIAQASAIKAKTLSITRRIQRFFEQEFLCPQKASRLIFSLFDWDEKIVLTLDRTNWKFGITDINILVVCGIYRGYSIPLCWILLPHQGNSNTSQRIDLIEMLSEFMPLTRIRFLLADREFIGVDWFQYLRAVNIPFCIRTKESMLVSDTRRGGKIKLKELFCHLVLGQFRELQQTVSGLNLRIFGTRTESGELLILAVFGSDDLHDAFALYSARWSIETMFKSFKTAGFNFEETHQKKLERLYKMMILLTIAYAWSVKIGEIKKDIQPIKIKKHGRPEFSWFSYGFRAIQTILLKGAQLQNKLFKLLENITLNKALLPCLTKVTVVY